MEVCVVHNTLNSVGGEGKVCLSIIEALKSMGHEVTLITVEPTDWDKVARIVGQVTRPDREISVLPFKVGLFGIYMRLLTSLKLVRSRCSMVINTHGDALPVTSDIIYMHFPTFAIAKETPTSIKYSKSLLWKLYFCPYERMQRHLAKRMKWKVLLTNSEFSRETIKKYIGTEAIVLPPPVDIGEFLKISGSKDRENTVVLCGRYTPEKNYEFALKVAKELPDVEFVVIGAYSGKVSDAYYLKLMEMKEKLDLINVKLLRNIPRDEQLRIYSRSKVFMHTMVGEHFGIAVVEGMAAGLVPVVHRSGGPWFDIVDRGRYGLGYRDINEAVGAVERALYDYEHLKERTVKRAMDFSKGNFLKKFKGIIENLESINCENSALSIKRIDSISR